METIPIGIVGCGNISGIYFKNLCTVFSNVVVKSCADLDADRTAAKVKEYPEVQICTLAEMLADPEIQILVNLTTPQGHFPVAMQAVAAGKHVYSEKPLTLTRGEGKTLLAAAAKAGVMVGNAPDTFLGAGIQTCRRLIEEGVIGTPIGAQAFMLCHGHESWHPDPEFYYKVGGGPMFDMGPYYLTALVSLLGPVQRVTGSARISFAQRTITSAKKNGQRIGVEVPTHVTGILDFASGAIGTMTTSFDVWASNTPRIEIFGSEGSLSVPDPNTFGGPVRIRLKGEKEWREMPLTCGFNANGRGIGPSDMAEALRTGRTHRANGALAYHVLELMHAFHDASEKGAHVAIESTCEKPAQMPDGLFEGNWQ
ncbi:MAG: Gfo/Idh/MocA family oxidoreductase [Kiritimatiellia bacterium]|nr:Gfo/Idh/MocA family oxidoreductase [Kiritimatiellia bacterium]